MGGHDRFWVELDAVGSVPVDLERHDLSSIKLSDDFEGLRKPFEVIAQELVVEAVEEEDEEKDDADLPVTHRKKKKGKKPARLVEYDPLTGTMVVRHRHKRGDGTFEEG